MMQTYFVLIVRRKGLAIWGFFWSYHFGRVLRCGALDGGGMDKVYQRVQLASISMLGEYLMVKAMAWQLTGVSKYQGFLSFHNIPSSRIIALCYECRRPYLSSASMSKWGEGICTFPY
jgi:hypothetical protein